MRRLLVRYVCFPMLFCDFLQLDEEGGGDKGLGMDCDGEFCPGILLASLWLK